MLRSRDALIWALLASCVSGLQPRADADAGAGAGTIAQHKGRKLQGRFLHITDFHPDPHYKTYSSTEQDAACHRKRGPAGYYGAETSACDSPKSLVNATLQWIKDNLADQVDFVIWTGDSARHDNDDKHPRTQKEIIKLNEFMVEGLTNVFGAGHGEFKVPIVPTFGNNDIMPHNILLAGPNKWTVKYLDIWRGFIPEAQRHQFQQGGWFFVEVIPHKLAVVSLNTMYFFTSNSGVDGCAKRHEPGYEHFEWLRIQLQQFRDRGMHAILIGHVPPARVNSKESWDETCWQKYALWQRQYRDVILGSFYGHMNIDHFMLHDFKQINKSTKKGAMTAKGLEGKSGEAGLLEDGEVTVASASDYLLDLRRAFSKLPAPPTQKKTRAISDYLGADEEEESSWWQKFSSAFSKSPKEGKDKKPKSDKQKYFDKIGGKYAQRYSVNLVSPSVVPNYFPTLRVIEYNITGLEDLAAVPVHNDPKRPISSSAQQPLIDGETISDHAYMREVQTVLKRKQKEADRDATKTKRKYKYKVPKGPQKGSEPGPAYRRQQLTLTGYTQYFANLTRINNDFVSDSVTDNATHSVFGLELGDNGDIDTSKWKEGKHHGHQGKKPRPEPHPAEFAFEVEYDTRTDKMYKLKDLTVRSFVDLGRRIGRQSPKSKALEVESQDDEMDTDIEDSDSDVSDDEFDHDDAAYKDDEELDGESEDGEEQDGEFEHEAEVESKKKHKGKKHKKKKKKHTKNRTWFTFVQRAFVGTMNPDDIEKVFGTRLESDEHDTLTEQNFETMEL